MALGLVIPRCISSLTILFSPTPYLILIHPPPPPPPVTEAGLNKWLWLVYDSCVVNTAFELWAVYLSQSPKC